MNIIQNLDNTILQFIQLNLRNPILDNIMIFITSLGNGFTVWLVIGVILLINSKSRKNGAMIIFSLILCFIIGNLSIKPFIARVRPFDVIPLIDGLIIKAPTDFSFPSGHAMSAFAVSTVIYNMNKTSGILAFILSGFIGFSRLYLYVHYPSDVFFGILIGIAIGITTIKLFKTDKFENLLK